MAPKKELHDHILIIYGSGENAKEFYSQYLKGFRCVFCDSDPKKWGKEFCGQIIMSPEEMLKSYKSSPVIICSYSYQEILDSLITMGFTESNIFIDKDKYVHRDQIHIQNQIYWGSRTSHMLPAGVYSITRSSLSKKIILYGQSQAVEETANKFRLLGIEHVEMLKRTGMEEDGTINRLLDMGIEEAECILVDGYSEKLLKYVKSTGVDLDRFRWLDDYSPYYNIKFHEEYEKLIDPILGYTTVQKDDEYPGFIKYEWMDAANTDPLVIITSGSSTTTGYWTQNCWSQYLSEILKEKGICHRIYCAGIEAYKTSQELLKLIRDGVRLEPDLFLSLNGMNELEKHGVSGYAFHSRFHEIMCRKTLQWSGMVNDSFGNGFKKADINYGIRDTEENTRMWYENIKMMYAVCSCMNIVYRAFLEPCILTKKQKYLQDRNCLATLGIYEEIETNQLIYTSEYAKTLEPHVLFEQEAKKYKKSFLEDLSGIFDDEDGCYMDLCHVFEKGNRILAKEIYDRVEEVIAEIVRRKTCIS